MYCVLLLDEIPHRKLKNTIDPNLIVIDTNPLLNTEIDNIHKEFQRLVNNLKRKLIGDPDSEDEFMEGTNIFIFVIFLHNLAENAGDELVEGAIN